MRKHTPTFGLHIIRWIEMYSETSTTATNSSPIFINKSDPGSSHAESYRAHTWPLLHKCSHSSHLSYLFSPFKSMEKVVFYTLRCDFKSTHRPNLMAEWDPRLSCSYILQVLYLFKWLRPGNILERELLVYQYISDWQKIWNDRQTQIPLKPFQHQIL